MKRVRALILALLMVFTLCTTGCSKPLTSSNIEDYLAVKLVYTTLTERFLGAAYSNVSLRIYPVKSGDFNNVKLTIPVTLSDDFSVNANLVSNDWVTFIGSPQEGCHAFELMVDLPSSGEYTTNSIEIHTIITITEGVSIHSMNLEDYVTLSAPSEWTITGTFIPN